MKVCIVTHFPDNPTRPNGGVEAVSVNLVKGLAQIPSLEIHVVTLDTSISAKLISEWGTVTIHRLPIQRGSVLLNSCSTWKRILQTYLMSLQPNIVHSHDTYGIMTVGLKLPQVFTIHGFIHRDTLLSKRNFSWARSKLWRFLEELSWARQPHIISISPYVRERLAGIAKGVIYDIDNPVAAESFSVRRNEIKGNIFSAAAICPRKNTLNLVKAFSIISNKYPYSSLRLAGPIVDKNYELLVRNLIKETKLTERIHLLGNVSTSQVRSELASASIFALLSFEENSPMGIEEAMAAGVPVITSNCCGMPYMVTNGESGYLVNPTNLENIITKFKSLLDDDTRRASMGSIARETALRRFHPSIIAKKTEQVYIDIIQT